MPTLAQQRQDTAAAAAVARVQARARMAQTEADDTFITPGVARDMRHRIQGVTR